MHVELVHVRALNSMSNAQNLGNSTSVTKHDFFSQPCVDGSGHCIAAEQHLVG